MHATAGQLKAPLNPKTFSPGLFWELLRKPRCSQYNCHWETQNGLKQPQLDASEKLNSTEASSRSSSSALSSHLTDWHFMLIGCVRQFSTLPQCRSSLFFFRWPQILCSSVPFFFSVHLQGNVRKLPGELKAPGWTTDLQLCCFSSSSAALAIVLNSSRGPTLSGESALSLHSSLWSLCWTMYVSKIQL